MLQSVGISPKFNPGVIDLSKCLINRSLSKIKST